MIQQTRAMNEHKNRVTAPEQELIEIAWRRELTESERRKYLKLSSSSENEFWSQLEQEETLTQTLVSLPPASLASNFTSRVLQAVQLETNRTRTRTQTTNRTLNWFHLFQKNWIAQFAALLMLVAITFASVTGFQSYQRQQIARSLEVMSDVASIAEVDWLKDFEMIRSLSVADRLSTTLESDAALLAALQ